MNYKPSILFYLGILLIVLGVTLILTGQDRPVFPVGEEILVDSPQEFMDRNIP